jgi:hypothetical protein
MDGTSYLDSSAPVASPVSSALSALVSTTLLALLGASVFIWTPSVTQFAISPSILGVHDWLSVKWSLLFAEVKLVARVTTHSRWLSLWLGVACGFRGLIER